MPTSATSIQRATRTSTSGGGNLGAEPGLWATGWSQRRALQPGHGNGLAISQALPGSQHRVSNAATTLVSGNMARQHRVWQWHQQPGIGLTGDNQPGSAVNFRCWQPNPHHKIAFHRDRKSGVVQLRAATRIGTAERAVRVFNAGFQHGSGHAGVTTPAASTGNTNTGGLNPWQCQHRWFNAGHTNTGGFNTGNVNTGAFNLAASTTARLTAGSLRAGRLASIEITGTLGSINENPSRNPVPSHIDQIDIPGMSCVPTSTNCQHRPVPAQWCWDIHETMVACPFFCRA